MENIFVEFLPPWVETGLQPAFYDKESGTVLQQTARMYDRVNMLVRMFNKLSKNTKDEIERFETETTEEIDNFEHDVNETVNEYIDKFDNLYNYVHDYFDNLDVQNEINHKLEEMVDDGTLQELINHYLQPKVIWSYNSVAEMKADENLIDGDFANTLGYYSTNDGGGSKYRIYSTAPSGYYETLDSGLYAQLIIDNSTTIMNFGAKANRGNDIKQYWDLMLTHCGCIRIPYGEFLISTPITISGSYPIDCQGSLQYDGNAYAFIVNSGNNARWYFRRFTSNDGGMFNISPINDFSFVDITIDYCKCAKETTYMNANNATITLIKYRGTRWWSTASSPIVMYQDTSTQPSTFMSQLDFFDMDLLSENSGKAIQATCTHATKSINFNLTNVDMENSTGISCTDRISSLGLYNCRMGEINYKQGWLTFNNYMPKVTIIGQGDLDPHYFTFNNLPNLGLERSIVTDMDIVDHTSSTTYTGGGIVTSTYMKPFVFRPKWKSISGDIDNNAVTLPAPSLEGNIYNYFTFTNENNLTITVPSTLTDDFYFSTNSGIDVTVVAGNKTVTVPSSTHGKLIKIYASLKAYDLRYSVCE